MEFNMYLLMLGIAGLLMKYLEYGPVADWSWWIVLSPFGLAVLWWTWADKSGYTKRVEMEKMDKRKQDRIDKQRDAMGMLSAKNKGKKK
jgi:small Trp-rich protein